MPGDETGSDDDGRSHLSGEAFVIGSIVVLAIVFGGFALVRDEGEWELVVALALAVFAVALAAATWGRRRSDS